MKNKSANQNGNKHKNNDISDPDIVLTTQFIIAKPVKDQSSDKVLFKEKLTEQNSNNKSDTKSINSNYNVGNITDNITNNNIPITPTYIPNNIPGVHINSNFNSPIASTLELPDLNSNIGLNNHNSYNNYNSPLQNLRFNTPSVFGSPSNLSTISVNNNKPILPPLQMVTNNAVNMNSISLKPLTTQNIQHQTDLQVLLEKIKNSDVNSNCENKKETVVANILDKSALLNQSNPKQDDLKINKLLNNKILNPPNNSYSLRENSKNSSTYSEYSNVSNKSPNEMTVDDIFDYLKIESTETINVYDGFVPILYKFSRINNFGPLAWISTLLKDPFVSPLREEVLRHKKKQLFQASNENEIDFHDKFLRDSGLDDIKPLVIVVHPSKEGQNDPRGVPVTKDALKIQKSMYNIPFDGTVLNTHINSKCVYFNMDFALQQILKVLPNKKVIWLSIKRFFNYVYPLVPYIDQTSFINDIEKLLGGNHFKDKFSEERVDTIHMSKKMDFAILGTLLIVLKFSEVSLIVNDDPNDESIIRTNEEQYLLDHPLNERMMNVAQSCLNQFKLLRRCALPIFQLALLMNEYERFNGLTDGNTADGQIFLTMLIQMGVSIGLNRDPSKFDLLISKGKMGNLWRKIWYGLLSLDIKQYIRFGSGKSFHDDFFDTELPLFDEESSNIENYDLERVVIEKIRLNYKFDKEMANLATYLCSFKTEPNVSKILKKLFDIEKMIKEIFGTLKDILNLTSELFIEKIRKVWDFTIYIHATGLILSVYHQLFVYYQKKENFKAIKFIKEKNTLTWLYLYSNFENIAIRAYKYFGTGFDMITTQTILLQIHSGWIDYMSTYVISVLAMNKINSFSSMANRVKVLEKICGNISNCSSWYLPSLKKLSKNHFYAWKLLKAHTFLMEVAKKSHLTFKLLDNKYNFIEHMNDYDLLCLLELTKNKNFAAQDQETSFFIQIKDRIRENRIYYPNKCDSVSSNSVDLTNVESAKQDMDVFMDKMFPIEAWAKPMEEDSFWRNIFLQKQQQNYPPSTVFNTERTTGFDISQSEILQQDVVMNGNYDITIPYVDHVECGCDEETENINSNADSTTNPNINQVTTNPNTTINIDSKIKNGNMNENGNQMNVRNESNGWDVINNSNTTNLFVDKTIFDMFN